MDVGFWSLDVGWGCSGCRCICMWALGQLVAEPKDALPGSRAWLVA